MWMENVQFSEIFNAPLISLSNAAINGNPHIPGFREMVGELTEHQSKEPVSLGL